MGYGSGARAGIRTRDLSVISRVLWPTELPSHVVQMGRLELPPGVVTRHGPEPCASANSATSAVLAEATGFEPAISAVTGPHVRPLHHASALGGNKMHRRLRRQGRAGLQAPARRLCASGSGVAPLPETPWCAV